MEELQSSLQQYNEQLSMIDEALASAQGEERQQLLALQSELRILVQLTQESLATISSEGTSNTVAAANDHENDLDKEYALFQQEMVESSASDAPIDSNKSVSSETSNKDTDNVNDGDSNIEDDLSTLLGMKCAVYHTHKWGGQPSLHNAMVSTVVPRKHDDKFNDLQVQILFTHPTHAEMLPCPFYLDGDCKYSDEQCRYSHGAVVQLSELKEAIEPNFECLKTGSRILMKLKPPDDEDTSLKKKSSEKYHLWHRAVVKSVDFEKSICVATLEHGIKIGDKRKSGPTEYFLNLGEIFPLNTDNDGGSDSDDSLSDTDYPENKASRLEAGSTTHELMVEKSLQNNCPAIGEWERHTRGIGSKLMLAMGYVPGTGLGAAGDGRMQPVEARLLPVGKSLDHCMSISEKAAAEDPLKVTQRLKKIQKREEERNRKAYEREKEREKANVFNFLNKTLGNKLEEMPSSTLGASFDIKQSTNKDLNIEQFKIIEHTKKLERELLKLNSSSNKYPSGSEGHRSLSLQILEKKKELNELKNKEQQITREQSRRKNKQSMSLF